MTIRRRAESTAPKRIWLTEDGRDQIQAWADEHGMSFSAAIETLAKLGMGEATEVALAPAILSIIRQELGSSHARLVRLILYGIIEAGIANRMASAAVKYQRQDEPGVYEDIRSQARLAAKRNIERGTMAQVIKEIMGYGGSEGERPDGEDADGDPGAGAGDTMAVE